MAGMTPVKNKKRIHFFDSDERRPDSSVHRFPISALKVAHL